jgi:hypothetical protein
MSSTTKLLRSKFEKNPRIALPDGCGIMTGTDQKSFRGMQLLYWSLTLSHDTSPIVVDCGMAGDQRDWCHHRGIKVHVPPHSSRIFPEGTWDKPVFIGQSPFSKTLWIAPDAVVTGDLNDIFTQINDQPFLVNDYYRRISNDEQLYRIRPVSARCPTVSDGVIGFDLERDYRFLEVWKKIVEVAYADDITRGWLDNGEQGAFMWAIEAAGYGSRATGDARYSMPVTPSSRPLVCDSVEEIIDSLHPLMTIQRFQGETKPWSHWEVHRQFDLEPENLSECMSRDICLFLLTNEKIPCSCVRAVDLESLPLGNNQGEMLGDNRIFLSNLAETSHTPYLGCCLSFVDLGQIRDHLSPSRVLVRSRVGNDESGLHWKHQLELKNPGIMVYLDEIEQFSGLKAGDVSFAGNEFLCDRFVYREFLAHWRHIYHYLLKKYNNNFSIHDVEPMRVPSLVYDAITMLYFSSRNDLRIVECFGKNIAFGESF